MLGFGQNARILWLLCSFPDSRPVSYEAVRHGYCLQGGTSAFVFTHLKIVWLSYLQGKTRDRPSNWPPEVC